MAGHGHVQGAAPGGAVWAGGSRVASKQRQQEVSAPHCLITGPGFYSRATFKNLTQVTSHFYQAPQLPPEGDGSKRRDNHLLLASMYAATAKTGAEEPGGPAGRGGACDPPC